MDSTLGGVSEVGMDPKGKTNSTQPLQQACHPQTNCGFMKLPVEVRVMIYHLLIVPKCGKVKRPNISSRRKKHEVLVDTSVMLTCKDIAREARGVLEAKASFTLGERKQNSKVFPSSVDSRDRRAIAEFRHTVIHWEFHLTNIAFKSSRFIQLLNEVADAAREPIYRDRPIEITLKLSHKNFPTWRVRKFALTGPVELIWLEFHARHMTNRLRTRLESHRNHVVVNKRERPLPRYLDWEVQEDFPYNITWRNNKAKEQYRAMLTNQSKNVQKFPDHYEPGVLWAFLRWFNIWR